MPISGKKWTLKPVDLTEARAFADVLGIRLVYTQLLLQRDICTFEEARNFFRPSRTDLHSPWLMKDMQEAVDRIDQAIRQKEKILIYGDYDVDGTTAVALVFSFLRTHYPHVDFYLPHRYREGYGISRQSIDFAKQEGFSVMIALDCGIKALQKIQYARSLGLDIIVCDHHLPDTELPPACAILNPKQDGCDYPYKELSGCGIGFKLICALAEHWELPPESCEAYLDLVAVSIAADIVPVSGENRALAALGLGRINEKPSPGIAALLRHSGLQGVVRMSDLIYMIAPRINAAGRMDEARTAVLLFIEKNPDMAWFYAGLLHQFNAERKAMDKTMTEEALTMLSAEISRPVRKSTVLYQPHWHKGVIGIVASRVMETYYRPTVILTQSGEMVSGSARSVSGFNIHEALYRCRHLLESYGGHFYAAGITLNPDNVPAFTETFERVVEGSIDPLLLVPEIKIDAEVSLKDMTSKFYSIIQQFEPFGPRNVAPLFLACSVRDTGRSRIVKENHIRFEIKQPDSDVFTGIGFNMKAKFPLVNSGKPFDICFTLDENEWQGQRSLQLRVADLRPSLWA